MTVIFIAPQKKSERMTISDDDALHDLRRLVDGWIEIVRPVNLPRPFCMVVDDCGLIKDRPVNDLPSVLYGIHGAIHGPAVIMAEGIVNGEPDLVGLTDADAVRLLRIFDRLQADLADPLERCDSCEYADDCQTAGCGCIAP